MSPRPRGHSRNTLVIAGLWYRGSRPAIGWRVIIGTLWQVCHYYRNVMGGTDPGPCDQPFWVLSCCSTSLCFSFWVRAKAVLLRVPPLGVKLFLFSGPCCSEEIGISLKTCLVKTHVEFLCKNKWCKRAGRLASSVLCDVNDVNIFFDLIPRALFPSFPPHWR